MPITTFYDPILATLNILRSRLPAEQPGVRFGTDEPNFTQRGGDLPYVRVRLDGSFGKYPVTQSATVRVQVYAATEPQALALAHVVQALLLSYEGGTEARSFGFLTGPIITRDPDTQTPLAFLTTSARLRPRPLE